MRSEQRRGAKQRLAGCAVGRELPCFSINAARRGCLLCAANEWIRAGEQPGGQDLSKWGRNGRIEAQRALAAAQVTPMATQKEAGRGKSI